MSTKVDLTGSSCTLYGTEPRRLLNAFLSRKFWVLGANNRGGRYLQFISGPVMEQDDIDDGLSRIAGHGKVTVQQSPSNNTLEVS